MSPRPEDSPISSPRTRSPAKGVRTGGMSCAGPDALSMLNMLAEVASVTLHTDPSVTATTQTCRVKTSSTTSRRPSDYDLLTLDHVSGMTDNLLLKLFAEFESNEMWKRFTYTCGMLPAACSKYFQSFGSEHKARSGMKAHLQTHLKSLLEVHKSGQSRQSYLLESVPARKRRLTQQDPTGGRKRGNTGHARANKSSCFQKTPLQDGDAFNKTKKMTPANKEKENEALKKRDSVPATSDEGNIGLPLDTIKQDIKEEVLMGEAKPKRKLETGREGKVRTKKVKPTANPHIPAADVNDNNNNKSDVKPAIESTVIPQVKKEAERPPIQQVVSHDHGYLRASSMKWDSGHTETRPPEHQPTRESLHRNHTQASSQMAWGGGGRLDGSVSCLQVKEEHLPEDRSTLLHQHMNEELQGGIMAQGCGSAGTPLPVVGCEIEFTPDQHYKVMRSADLPVVYDHNNPAVDMEGAAKVIERDEYKVRKKPKGRAKFIGQSKAEKEMALKLITEIRSQSVMALETLECKICHPPRLFTAPSTLLSHYRSHAGIRPYECRICEAVFTRQHSLNYHMLIHTNQTRFTCSDCGRKFRHPSHFKEHRRRHTGESPYECSDCLMRFKTRNTYKRHLRTRHGKLLTTQGTIIILSQEEADRMKKSQGRKPRRPRQPLKIISPEAAAQMEEEQVWTDFEEGDREEEEEEEEEEEDEEEEEEGPNYGEVLQSSKQQGEAGSYQVLSDNVMTSRGIRQISNGKTGLVRSKNISDQSNISQINHIEQIKEWENPLQADMRQDGKSSSQCEIVEEEIVMEGVGGGDLRTYVFQPPPEHNTLPKVNIRSSWNTINIDLKSLEMASELIIPESTGEIVEGPLTEMNTELTNMDTGCKEVIGDQITPEEVITICSSMDSVSEEVDNSGTIQPSTNHNNPDWFTVKKPIKCYSRPVYGVSEHHEAVPAASCALPNTKVNSQGVYVVEYVHSNDGRLAKVYRASASVVPKSVQQGSVQVPQVITVPSRVSVPTIIGSGSDRTLPVCSIKTTSKLVPQIPESQGGLDVSLQNPASRITTQSNNRLTISYDKPLVHKQIMNDPGKDNTGKSEGLIACREPQIPTVTLHSSPSVVVTTVPHVSEAQQLPGSHADLFPWSSQPLADNREVTTYSIGTGAKRTEALQNEMPNVENRNHLNYPLINQEVEQYVGVQDDILLENVEISDSFDVGGDDIIVNTGIVEEGVCVVENLTQLGGVPDASTATMKVEELGPCEASMLGGTTQYVDQLLHHNMMVTNEQDASPPPVSTSVVHNVASTLQV